MSQISQLPGRMVGGREKAIQHRWQDCSQDHSKPTHGNVRTGL